MSTPVVTDELPNTIFRQTETLKEKYAEVSTFRLILLGFYGFAVFLSYAGTSFLRYGFMAFASLAVSYGIIQLHTFGATLSNIFLIFFGMATIVKVMLPNPWTERRITEMADRAEAKALRQIKAATKS